MKLCAEGQRGTARGTSSPEFAESAGDEVGSDGVEGRVGHGEKSEYD